MKTNNDEIVANWEADLEDSNREHFTIDTARLIDETEPYLRDKILALYSSKKLEVRVAAALLTAVYHSGKQVFFISQKRLFRLYSSDPNLKEQRKAEFNGEEYDKIYRYLEKTCFRTIEESTTGVTRFPAIVQLKHVETIDAMNARYGHLTRSEIGYYVESAYQWRRKICDKKNLKDPSKGYFDDDVDIDTSLDDLHDTDVDSVPNPSEPKNTEQIVIKLPYTATADEPVVQEKTGWQRK